MSIHVGKKLNDIFDVWMKKMYGGYGRVKNTRGHVHDYPIMTYDLSDKDKVKIDMINYMSTMVCNYFTKFNPYDTIPDPETGYFCTTGNCEEMSKRKVSISSQIFRK